MSSGLKLPSIDYKEFKILTLCKNKEFANINYMAEELKVTTRSVRTYIKQLNDNLGEDIAQIIYVKGHGYKLEIRDDEIWKLHTSTRTGQTLFDLYKNLVVEFMEYKKVYNLNTIREISEENKRLRQEIERLNQEKERIYTSTSWKVTKPVRWLGKNLKRGNTGGK